MLTGLPSYVTHTFLAAVTLTFLLFMAAAWNKLWPSLVMILWLALTGILAYTGFFTDTSGIPPAFTLAVAPALLLILYLQTGKKGKAFTNSLDLRTLTWLHIVRVPVELVLYWLAASQAVPELMTFEGEKL